MPLMPKRVKFRKVSKGNRSGYATSGTELAYGEFGLKALTRGLLTATQIEACRVAINREMKRKGKLWIRVFPDKPVTRKPIEVRMGGGKGNPEFWAAVILPGKVLFEVGGVSEEVAKQPRRAQGPQGRRRLEVRREDRQSPGLVPRASPGVRQGDHAHEELPGARRGRHGQGRRHRHHHGNASAQRHEALAHREVRRTPKCCRNSPTS